MNQMRAESSFDLVTEKPAGERASFIELVSGDDEALRPRLEDLLAEDLALTLHAHPTLHESVGLSAEIFPGVITDLPSKKSGAKRGAPVRS
ncbi:MAG: hypothetical protein IH892_04575 [Planctomycetes bacterium]|nr:hypothetical protein [Planctomycetota bacterium]